MINLSIQFTEGELAPREVARALETFLAEELLIDDAQVDVV